MRKIIQHCTIFYQILSPLFTEFYNNRKQRHRANIFNVAMRWQVTIYRIRLVLLSLNLEL